MQRSRVTSKVTQMNEADEVDKRTPRTWWGLWQNKAWKHILFKRQLLLNSSLLLLCGPFVDGSGDPLGEARDLDCYMNVFNINNYFKKKAFQQCARLAIHIWGLHRALSYHDQPLANKASPGNIRLNFRLLQTEPFPMFVPYDASSETRY